MTGGLAPRRAGARKERETVAYLATHGFPYAERAYGAGRPDDRGDIVGVPGFVLQVRARKETGLAALGDAERQLRNQAQGRIGYAAAILPRRNHTIAQAYVVMTLETFAALAADGR